MDLFSECRIYFDSAFSALERKRLEPPAPDRAREALLERLSRLYAERDRLGGDIERAEEELADMGGAP
jgi:hypothetical protein